jgi:hypothetical protein
MHHTISDWKAGLEMRIGGIKAIIVDSYPVTQRVAGRICILGSSIMESKDLTVPLREDRLTPKSFSSSGTWPDAEIIGMISVVQIDVVGRISSGASTAPKP